MNVRKRNGGSGEGGGRDEFAEIESGIVPESTKIKGDEKNIAILFFLYLLQGVPLGLMQAFPIVLTNMGVSYKQQAVLSLASWPFSLKLFWAPIVDWFYWRKLGRRKSWLIPSQYLIGIVMLILSSHSNYLLGIENKEPKIELLTMAVFLLNFLAATQDIAVDGWALTMLRRHNVSHASTCNSVGQTAGYFLGYVVFVALESSDFCNTYLRSEPQPHGIFTLSGFLNFWGWTFIITTTLILWLKSEKEVLSVSKSKLSITDSYKLLVKIIFLRPVRLLAAILLTAKVAFAACDVVTGLKLIEAGVPREKIALLAVPLFPLQVLLPLYLSRFISGRNTMEIYLRAYPYRLFLGIPFAIFVWITPYIVFSNQEIPKYYYITFIIIYCLHQVTANSMYVSQMAFFATVSDPAAGGTYMTLLNTLANAGGTWPQSLSLWLVDYLTIKECSTDLLNNCINAEKIQECEANKGHCGIKIDGFYVEMGLCTLIGCIWFLWGRRAIRKLNSFNSKSFSIGKNVSVR